jgi:CBS domain-containing protein
MIPKSLVEYISDKSTVRQALEKMSFHRYTAIVVLNANGEYVGTLRNDDILNYFLKNGSFDKVMAEDVPVTEIFNSATLRPLLHSAPVSELIEAVKEHNFVPIVDDRGCFIGIVLRREILNYLLTLIKDK